jgi:DNA topoisomerase-1
VPSLEKYVLIVTEKPEVARRIAQALDKEGKPEKVEENGVPYFRAVRNRKLVVVPTLGHLYTVVHGRGRRNYYPVFNFKWAPRYLAERKAKNIQAWIEVIANLAEGADEFIAACDYDLEGSLIGYCVLKYACKNKENNAKRMKFSTLMKSELEKAYEELLPKLDFRLVAAGKTRHEVDWLYGINLSRALTLAAKRWSGRYATLSTGRVQGPTLRFLVEREKDILCFVPTPFWSIKAEAEMKGSVYEAEYEKGKIETQAEADAVVNSCLGKSGKMKAIEVKKFRQMPPVPFDVGSLQAEAYRFFGYTPRGTLNIAERLYLQALISYPRTSSQKLPPVINYRAILTSLSKNRKLRKSALKLLRKTKLKPNEGKKSDPAHPAVYPTGNLPERPLSDPEKKIFNLVVSRFMAVFGEPAVKQSVKLTIDVGGHVFYLRGKQILKAGWMNLYKPYVKTEEVILPSIKEGENVRFMRVLREDKFINPPSRYNPSSLLKKMEEEGIGTKVTRADIVETLYNRNYILEKRIFVTGLGFDVTEVLNKYCPSVISVELTRELERKMEQIRSGEENRETVVMITIDQLKPVLEEFKTQETAIGEALSNAIKKARLQERTVGSCPHCGTGKLIILYSRKTGKRFIGCTNYFKKLCETSFPLPQRGTVKPELKDCGSCGWPLLQIRMKGKRPWRLCFNPDCPLKKKKKCAS